MRLKPFRVEIHQINGLPEKSRRVQKGSQTTSQGAYIDPWGPELSPGGQHGAQEASLKPTLGAQPLFKKKKPQLFDREAKYRSNVSYCRFRFHATLHWFEKYATTTKKMDVSSNFHQTSDSGSNCEPNHPCWNARRNAGEITMFKRTVLTMQVKTRLRATYPTIR